METRSKKGVYKPRVLLTHLDKQPHMQLHEPKTFKQAVACPNWQEAMTSEFDALLRNKTGTLVPPSSLYNKVIGSKWVYKHTNSNLMVPSNDTKLGWLHRVSFKLMAWIISRLLVPL